MASTANHDTALQAASRQAGQRAGLVVAAGLALASVLVFGIAVLFAVLAVLALVGVARIARPASSPTLQPCDEQRLAAITDPRQAVREQSLAAGAGAFLGFSGGRWVSAEPEHAVLVLGPPRSGKTTSVVIPALLACPGAAISTSTKPDVLRATLNARRAVGDAWLFDPSGEDERRVDGVIPLHWSPVAAAGSWDHALLTARAMTLAAPAVGKGTQHEAHWSERAAALLAPLLYAASLHGEAIAAVLRWVLRADLDTPTEILAREHADIACDVLHGIAETDGRERSSIFSATAGVLALYNSDAARHAAQHPNFDPEAFVGSTDTVFITAPAHRQALCAPLVVGLLEQIRHATYHRAATNPGGLPVFFCLDELANIAPIHDLPALVSEAGGQGLHVLACLQDLSQARQRWGDPAADGLLSLFQTKLLLGGISDPRTLEAISLVLGEYDRQLVSRHLAQAPRHGGCWGPGPTNPKDTEDESVTYHSTRQRRLPPGDIAAIRSGNALLVRGAKYELINTTPYYQQQPWNTLAGDSAQEYAPQTPAITVRAAA